MYWPENQISVSNTDAIGLSSLLLDAAGRVVKMVIKCFTLGTSLDVQWIRPQTSTARGVGSIPGLGTKILHATWYSQNISLKKLMLYFVPLNSKYLSCIANSA